jgi:hypothetical protein
MERSNRRSGISPLCPAGIRLFGKHLKWPFTTKRFVLHQSGGSLPSIPILHCSKNHRIFPGRQMSACWTDAQGWTEPPPTLEQICRRFGKSMTGLATISRST